MLPLLTTRSVLVEIQATLDGDPSDSRALPWHTVVSGLPCHISAPSGREVGTGSQRIDAVLLGPRDTQIQRSSRVTDPDTGEVWMVLWVEQRTGLGLDHQKAGLRRINGSD